MADWGSPVSGAVYVGQWQALSVPNASTHTKGAWADLFTLSRSGAIQLSPSWGQNYTTHRTMLFDLAVGSAGNEKIFLSNLMVSFSAVGINASRAHVGELVLPITLPAGELIRIRSQSSYASNAGCYFNAASANIPCPWTGSVIDTYGANTANSAGTTVTADNAAFTFGAYAQLTASCSRMECFFVAISPRSAQNGFSDQDGFWELAVGGSGSEKAIASGYVSASLATQLSTLQWFGPYYQQIAPGQRLSARLSRQNTTSQRTLDFIIYGVR